MTIIAYAKRNPFIVGGAVLAFAGISYLVFNRSSGEIVAQQSQPSEYDLAMLQQSSQERQMQLGAQTQLIALREQGDVTIRLAEIERDASFSSMRLQADFAQAELTTRYNAYLAELDARTTENLLDNQLEYAGIEAQTNITLANINAQSAVAAQQLQSIREQIGASKDLGLAQIDANKAIALGNQGVQVAQIKSAARSSMFGSVLGLAGRLFG